MDDINEFKKSLIKDLYNLSVNCDITVEELADDICDDCRHFYNQALEDFADALIDGEQNEEFVYNIEKIVERLRK